MKNCIVTKDLTPDKQLLSYLKEFGIGNYQRIDIFLQQIYSDDLDYQAFLNQKTDGLFWSLILDLEQSLFIKYRIENSLNGTLLVTASIQQKGIDYITEEKKRIKFGQVVIYVAAVATIYGTILQHLDNKPISTSHIAFENNKGASNSDNVEPTNTISQAVKSRRANRFQANNFYLEDQRTKKDELNQQDQPKQETFINGLTFQEWEKKMQDNASGKTDISILDGKNYFTLGPQLNGSANNTQTSLQLLSSSTTSSYTPTIVNIPNFVISDGKFLQADGKPIQENAFPIIANQNYLGSGAMPSLTSLMESNGQLSNFTPPRFKSVGFSFGGRTVTDSEINDIYTFLTDPKEQIDIYYDSKDDESKSIAEDLQRKINFGKVHLYSITDSFLLNASFLAKFTISEDHGIATITVNSLVKKSL